jgi:hypothetical protein
MFQSLIDTTIPHASEPELPKITEGEFVEKAMKILGEKGYKVRLA